ncbi:MAG: glycosyltransferase family 4 protein [Candidatus Binatia bacterium]
MRVELVFPKFKLLSGAERLILNLGRGLASRGHRVRILCHRFDPTCLPLADGLEIEETGIRLDRTGNHYLDSALTYLSTFRLKRLVARDAQVVCLFGPALLLASGRFARGQRIFYFCYEPPRAADIDRADVLARVGAWRWALRPLLRGYVAVDRWLVGRVDGVLVAGRFAVERILAAYGRRAWSISQGVSLPAGDGDRASARPALGLGAEEAVAVSVGFLHPRKRIDLLLRSWAEVERQLARARLLVVGDGPERDSLRRLAATLGLARVRFCGFVAETELPSYYRAADLLVHVAREETFGLTILEAASFGVPAVVVDEGGPRYTVEQGETGLRVAATEPEIAAALLSLLGAPERSRRMGEEARIRVARDFVWERGAEDFLAACAALGVA